MKKITKQSLIHTNRVFGGSPSRNNSLSYAVLRANNEKNTYRKIAFLVRNMTSDHAFVDGNKRTSATVVLSEFRRRGIKCDRRKLARTLVLLSRSGEGDINKIERSLRRCSRK